MQIDSVQVTTIVGEVAEVLSGEDMQRPERAEKLPADNAVELKDVRFAYHDKDCLLYTSNYQFSYHP